MLVGGKLDFLAVEKFDSLGDAFVFRAHFLDHLDKQIARLAAAFLNSELALNDVPQDGNFLGIGGDFAL